MLEGTPELVSIILTSHARSVRNKLSSALSYLANSKDFCEDEDKIQNARLLIRAGADIDTVDCPEKADKKLTDIYREVKEERKWFNPLLISAVKAEDTERAKEYIEKGANPNAWDDDGDCSLLHIAAENGDPEMIRILAAGGADLNSKNEWDETPLCMAVTQYPRSYNKTGRFAAIKALIECGADVNKCACHSTLQGYDEHENDIITYSSESPLWRAVTPRDKRWRLLPVDLDLVRLLIDAGADVYDSCALNEATERGNTDLVRILLDAGADINAMNNREETPLHLTVEDNYTGIARMLITAGADVDARDEWGCTPLHKAGMYNCPEMAHILLEAGAYVKAKADNGDTPLHCAARNGSTETIRVLLDAGADINAKNRNGETPLHLAEERGKTEIVRMLTDAGAHLETAEEEPER